MSAHIDICDAVVARLNAAPVGTFSEAFTAALSFDPTEDRVDLSSLQVDVMPAAREVVQGTRAKMQETITVSIGIRKQASASDVTAMKLRHNVVEQIYDYMAQQSLATYAAAKFSDANISFPAEPLIEDRTFLAVVNVTYLVWR